MTWVSLVEFLQFRDRMHKGMSLAARWKAAQ